MNAALEYIIVGLIVAGALVYAVHRLRPRRSKPGEKPGCAGGCVGCALAEGCASRLGGEDVRGETPTRNATPPEV